MRNVSHKNRTGNQNTHFMFNNFFSENLSSYETMWKDFVEAGMLQMTIWHTCIARWIPKATDTRSEYVIHIAVPLQQ
jgi:hypothetical protein